MDIVFYNYGEFLVEFVDVNGNLRQFHKWGAHGLKMCADFAHFKMEVDSSLEKAMILDYNTGEVVLEIVREA